MAGSSWRTPAPLPAPAARWQPWLALALFVPAPSVGVLLALHMEQGVLGSALWAAAKVWLFLGPLVWLIRIERMRPGLSPPRHGGLGVGLALGAGMLVVIWGAYALLARGLVDAANFQTRLAAAGLTSATLYLGVSAYWTFVNALLEEYVFRFFLFRQSERIWPRGVAVAMTALFFTFHHTLALAAYVPAWQNALASAGVFAASVIWSWLYARYRSIWPCYVCHVLADVAVFSIGWDILFG